MSLCCEMHHNHTTHTPQAHMLLHCHADHAPGAKSPSRVRAYPPLLLLFVAPSLRRYHHHCCCSSPAPLSGRRGRRALRCARKVMASPPRPSPTGGPRMATGLGPGDAAVVHGLGGEEHLQRRVPPRRRHCSSSSSSSSLLRLRRRFLPGSKMRTCFFLPRAAAPAPVLCSRGGRCMGIASPPFPLLPPPPPPPSSKREAYMVDGAHGQSVARAAIRAIP